MEGAAPFFRLILNCKEFAQKKDTEEPSNKYNTSMRIFISITIYVARKQQQQQQKKMDQNGDKTRRF